MGNLGGGEILVILLVALVVLGPTRLPTAARQIGKAISEFRRVSSGFQQELQSALDDPAAESEARERGRKAVAASNAAMAETKESPAATPAEPPVPDASDAGAMSVDGQSLEAAAPDDQTTGD